MSTYTNPLESQPGRHVHSAAKHYSPFDYLSDSLVKLMAEHVEGEGHSVLFVDDEVNHLRSLADLYGRAFVVQTAASADEAEQIMASNRECPACAVVSDQMMPQRTGAELFASLREKYPTTTRVLFSAYSSVEAVESAVNMGEIHRYVRKPFDPVIFGQTLREAVARSVLMRRFQDAASRRRD